MTVTTAMSERFSNLVAPLAKPATVTRATDTSGQFDLFGASGAVTTLIGAAPGLRDGDVDSATGPRTPATTPMPGVRTSATATRTTTTRTTSSRSCSSADQTVAGRRAGFSFIAFVEAYLDARRTKRNKNTARAFEVNQEQNLYTLHADLAAGTYRPGPSTCFIITRPKPREVWAAEFRDRVVHHLLYAAIGPANWRLMANTGVRRGESLILQRHWMTDAVRIQSTGEERTKSGEWRKLPMTDGVKLALAEIDAAKKEGDNNPYLLPRMAPESLSRAFARDAKAAKVGGSLHSLRHSYVCHMLLARVPIRTVQLYAGHASITTTENYAYQVLQQDSVDALRLAI